MTTSNELKLKSETEVSSDDKKAVELETEFKPLPPRDQENKENEGEKKLD